MPKKKNNKPRCKGLNAQEFQCKRPAMPDSDWCWHHNPYLAHEREAAYLKRNHAAVSQGGAKGGKLSSRKMEVFRDEHTGRQLSVRGIVADLVHLTDILKGGLRRGRPMPSEMREHVRLTISAYKELRSAVKTAHQMEGAMPPVRLQLEHTVTAGISEMSDEQLEALDNVVMLEHHRAQEAS